MGFWWHFKDTHDCDAYLQLEQDKLCFKISVDDEEKRKNLRQLWHEKILSKCQESGLKAKRPNRFGNGQYMTVAILDQEYQAVNDKGLIDMPGTLKTLQSAQSVLDACWPTV
ncbi:hypothetical protein G7045_09455 [Acidovorax sp. HDW3]|uniref:hypothetical protein n=1 Tax=Acidovorax sp. HDW3 TaxID=2714923 RepID=UPI00140C278D|nr:hypothetical protein [Acidovorax sp. HDW3]QIL44467.1 hypothetical protein G7045_09455 [Acidovorax sp. HDW3]